MKKWTKRILLIGVVLFVIANIIVYNHAYCFTHFSSEATQRPKRPEELGMAEKIKTLFTGVAVSKPKNTVEPKWPYEIVNLQSHKKLEAWDIPMQNSKGVVILFHGYISCKANMLPYAEAFQQKGYSTIVLDFMGSGGSEGVETTIGFKEAKDVKVAFDYAKKKYPDKDIILFGTSMGAASIMKSIEQYNLQADKIILECPFASLLETAKRRFEIMGLPAVPLAHWLILFGGMQTGYNAFEHNPVEYAKHIRIPTALFIGAQDERVSQSEIKGIFDNLSGEKTMTIFKNSGHEIYLKKDALDWNEAVDQFLWN